MYGSFIFSFEAILHGARCGRDSPRSSPSVRPSSRRFWMLTLGPPPAQIPAYGTTAPGFCLGSNAQRRDRAVCPLSPLHIHGRAHSARWSGTVSGARFARPCPPWPSSFPPRPPQPASPRPCSSASQVLRACPTSPVRASSALSYALPNAARRAVRGEQTGELPRPALESSARARGLGPRRVQRCLAITASPVLLSASRNSVDTPVVLISRLKTLPRRAPVNASPGRCRLERMTRGHRGSLLLRSKALSSSLSSRFFHGALRAQRNPMMSLRFVGWTSWRMAARRLVAT